MITDLLAISELKVVVTVANAREHSMDRSFQAKDIYVDGKILLEASKCYQQLVSRTDVQPQERFYIYWFAICVILVDSLGHFLYREVGRAMAEKPEPVCDPGIAP